MWSMKNVKNESISYSFLVGEDKIVGRRCAQIVLEDDPSISRRHALLRVLHSPENLSDISKASVLKLKDESSKYGTFKNGIRLEKDEEVSLKHGDSVKFGQFENEFKVSCLPLILTTSCVEQASKMELKSAAYRLGGHVIPEWQTGCTHLVMSSIKVTVKALCCLVSLKPIVTPQYLADLISSCSKQSTLPQAEKYLPPVSEPLINPSKADFSIVPERNTLFNGKTFIFLDEKQMKKLHLALTLGGANATLITQKSKVDAKLLTRDGSCVIQPFGEQMKDSKFSRFLSKVQDEVQKKKKRLIPESDFGLAVSYCSTEKFCNPDFDAGANLFGYSKIHSQTFSVAEVYVPDTHDSSRQGPSRQSSRDGRSSNTQSSDASFNCTVQESVETVKRKRNSSGDSLPSVSNQRSKRIKVETIPDEVSGSSSETRDNKNNPTNKQQTTTNTECVELTSDDDDVRIMDVVNTVPLEDLTLETSTRSAPAQSRALSTDLSFSTASTSNHNGFQNTGRSNNDNAAAVNSDIDEIDDLPRNLIKIKVINLVKRIPVPTLPVTSNRNNGVNFKKFRKVLHIGAHKLPQIIGGRDLVSHVETMSHRAIDDWVRENTVVQQSEPTNSLDDHGEFDWNPAPSSSRRRMK